MSEHELIKELKSKASSLEGTLMVVDVLLVGDEPQVEEARDIIKEELERYE